jgi:ribonuclease Z
VKPGIITPLTLPDAWPTTFDRNSQDLSPVGVKTKLITVGTGMPLSNPYRAGPSYALIINNYPYLVEAEEGI